MIKQNFHLILASSSMARKKILSDLGLKFEAISPNFDEEAAKPQIKHLSIKKQALYLAKNKALSIDNNDSNTLILASDQICQIDNQPLSKSNDRKQAIEQLKILRGKFHYQNNAVCLYQGKKLLFSHFQRAKLRMRNLTDKEIIAYVDLDKSWGCAGSYKLESLGKHLFTSIKGDDDCIVGMAILPVINFLYKNKHLTING